MKIQLVTTANEFTVSIGLLKVNIDLTQIESNFDTIEHFYKMFVPEDLQTSTIDKLKEALPVLLKYRTAFNGCNGQMTLIIDKDTNKIHIQDYKCEDGYIDLNILMEIYREVQSKIESNTKESEAEYTTIEEQSSLNNIDQEDLYTSFNANSSFMVGEKFQFIINSPEHKELLEIIELEKERRPKRTKKHTTITSISSERSILSSNLKDKMSEKYGLQYDYSQTINTESDEYRLLCAEADDLQKERLYRQRSKRKSL